MPKVKKNSASANATAANVGYEAELWQMADALRGSMDAAEYKHVVLGASHDALISPALAQSTATMLGAEYRLLDGFGHAVMLEADWQRAAQEILDWLEARGM